MSEIILPEVNCSTAQEFLNAVSPIGPYFKDELFNSPWLFRGQGRDWPLKPSLFRTDPEAEKKFIALTGRNIVGDYGQLLLAERNFILDFFRIADKRGFIIPDDSQELRSDLDAVRVSDLQVVNGHGEWLSSGIALFVVTIAQHYGVPTRLLDWTLQPFIAGFFAAEGGIKRYREVGSSFENPDVPLVVWAFYYPRFGVKRSPYSEDFSIKGVTAAGASNPNLRPQQGVFTIVHFGFTKEMENNYLLFEDILEIIPSASFWGDVEDCKLQKFILPVNESFELIKLLAKLDITPSTIYPGYHSIISDLQNRNFWK